MAKGFTRPYVSASGSSGPSYTSISGTFTLLPVSFGLNHVYTYAGHIDFKESPFQTVLESVTPVQTCPGTSDATVERLRLIRC